MNVPGVFRHAGRVWSREFPRREPGEQGELTHWKCRLANERPEPDFRYFSNRKATACSLNSITTCNCQGRLAAVWTLAGIVGRTPCRHVRSQSCVVVGSFLNGLQHVDESFVTGPATGWCKQASAGMCEEFGGIWSAGLCRRAFLRSAAGENVGQLQPPLAGVPSGSWANSCVGRPLSRLRGYGATAFARWFAEPKLDGGASERRLVAQIHQLEPIVQLVATTQGAQRCRAPGSAAR